MVDETYNVADTKPALRVETGVDLTDVESVEVFFKQVFPATSRLVHRTMALGSPLVDGVVMYQWEPGDLRNVLGVGTWQYWLEITSVDGSVLTQQHATQRYLRIVNPQSK